MSLSTCAGFGAQCIDLGGSKGSFALARVPRRPAGRSGSDSKSHPTAFLTAEISLSWGRSSSVKHPLGTIYRGRPCLDSAKLAGIDEEGWWEGRERGAASLSGKSRALWQDACGCCVVTACKMLPKRSQWNFPPRLNYGRLCSTAASDSCLSLRCPVLRTLEKAEDTGKMAQRWDEEASLLGTHLTARVSCVVWCPHMSSVEGRELQAASRAASWVLDLQHS